jgi:hypothetical protein
LSEVVVRRVGGSSEAPVQQPLEERQSLQLRGRGPVRQMAFRAASSYDWVVPEAASPNGGFQMNDVRSVERGERNVTLLRIVRLAQALGVNAAVLARDLEPPTVAALAGFGRPSNNVRARPPDPSRLRALEAGHRPREAPRRRQTPATDERVCAGSQKGCPAFRQHIRTPCQGWGRFGCIVRSSSGWETAQL